MVSSYPIDGIAAHRTISRGTFAGRASRIGIVLFALGAAASSMGAQAVKAQRSVFGTLSDGRQVEAVTLQAGDVSARIIALGATLQSLEAPGRNGTVEDVVLGYDSAAEYQQKGGYFGVTVGRYANRIANGRFELDGRSFQLETNDGDHHLHGGAAGFDRKLWTLERVEQDDAVEREDAVGAVSRPRTVSAVFRHVSPDGEGGYPGTLTATATYRLSDDGVLTIEYTATTDRPTIVNLTNHSFFNLAGADISTSAMNHRLTLHAARFTPVDAGLIPVDGLEPVAGTPFDFTRTTRIGERVRDVHPQLRIGRGYDHNYVIDGEPGVLRPAARLEDPLSGRVLELATTAPGVQFYSGNFLDGTVTGKGGLMYRQGDGVCLEPQTYPDAPNRPAFPSARLNPGETYRNVIVYRLSVAEVPEGRNQGAAHD